MALIKCPRCGQTVLSVASTCPKCSYLLLQESDEESAAGALVECRRCSKRIPPESASCPYCAYPVRRIRVLVRAGIGAGVAVVALLVLLLTLGRRGGPDPVVASVAGRTPAEAADTPLSDGHAQAANPMDADTALRASPVEAAPPRGAPVRSPTAQRRTPSPDTAAAGQRPRPSPPLAAGVRNTRWSIDWVNVREGRGVDNAIVTVLRPGVQVQLADQRGGWWAVYLDGTFVGYASGSLFGSEPPADRVT